MLKCVNPQALSNLLFFIPYAFFYFPGGLDLAVQGISLAEDAEVYVDNQLCPTINWSPGEILCKVPPAPVSLYAVDCSRSAGCQGQRKNLDE